MKSSVLALVVVVLLVAVGSILWFAREHTASSPLSGPDAKGGISSAADHALDKDAASAEDKLTAPVDPLAPRADAASADRAPGLEVHGVVRRPICADDGPIEAYAIAEPGGIELVHAALEREAKIAPGDEPAPYGPRILARATVGPDLRFALKVPADTKSVNVLLLGRYWYTPASTAFTVDSSGKTLELVPECGAAVAGTVLPPDGVDVATLERMVVRVRASFEGITSGNLELRNVNRRAEVVGGRFEVRALDSHGGYVLVIAPEHLAAAETTVKELVAGRDSTARIQLLRGGTLRGLVRDASGAPIPAAKVEAQLEGRWFGFDNRTVRETKSDDAGAFELAAVTPGSVMIAANAKGFLTNDSKKVDVLDGGVTSGVDIQLGTGKSIGGSVTWSDGKPAAGVQVDVEFDKSQLYGMAALNAARGADGHDKTGADGRFTVTGLGAGPFTVRAAALADDDKAALEGADSKEKSSRKQRARADGVRPGQTDLQLVLKPASGLKGRVVDSKGEPIAGFHVHAERAGKGLLGNIGQPSVDEDVKDARGEFLIQIESEGDWKVTASGPGFATSDAVEIKIPRVASEPDPVLVLVRGATVKGTVTNPSGAPFPGAEVEISNGEPKWKRTIANERAPHAQSDPEGKFELDGVKPGKIGLVASTKAWAASTTVPLDLGPGDTAENVVLILREGGKLTGEVFDDGKPASGMLVQATEMAAFEQKIGNSDAQGRFTIEHMEPGTWQVVALPTSALGAGKKGDGDAGDDQSSLISKMKMGSAEIQDGAETHIVLGAAPTDPIAVHGRVTHAGQPYAGAMISFVGSGKSAMQNIKLVKIGTDGTYATTLDKPGDYDVTVQKLSGKPGEQSSVEFARTIPLVKDHVLDLQLPTARITGRVKTPDGDPAPGVRTSLRPESSLEVGTLWGGGYQESSTDEEGRFDLQALRPGTYTLFVGGLPMMGMLGGDAEFGREIRPGLKLSEGEWMRDLEIKLKKPGSAEITVVDDGGRPVDGASVFARDEDGRLLEVFSGLSTNPSGVAKHGGLSPGRYTFSARKQGLTSGESGKVPIESNEVKAVRIALSAGTILWVKAVDADEKTVPADIQVRDESGHEVGMMLSLADIMEMYSKGGFQAEERKIGPLAPGKYVVRAVRQGGSAEKPVTLTGQAERHLKIKFEK